jgi:hypothetical protein
MVLPGAGARQFSRTRRGPSVRAGRQKGARSNRSVPGRDHGTGAILAAGPSPAPPMPVPEYVTTDIYLSSFLLHRGATLTGLRRLGEKRVEFRFATGPDLHSHLRHYWSGESVPVVPWQLFMDLRRLKSESINRYA